MCKATAYIEQLNKIYSSIQFDRSIYKKKEYEYDLIQSDFLHFIENVDFSDKEGLKIIHELKKIRQERRKVKDEKRMLDELCYKINLSNSLNTLKDTSVYIKTQEDKEIVNWTYSFRSKYFIENEAYTSCSRSKKKCTALIVRPSCTAILK